MKRLFLLVFTFLSINSLEASACKSLENNSDRSGFNDQKSFDQFYEGMKYETSYTKLVKLCQENNCFVTPREIMGEISSCHDNEFALCSTRYKVKEEGDGIFGAIKYLFSGAKKEALARKKIQDCRLRSRLKCEESSIKTARLCLEKRKESFIKSIGITNFKSISNIKNLFSIQMRSNSTQALFRFYETQKKEEILSYLDDSKNDYLKTVKSLDQSKNLILSSLGMGKGQSSKDRLLSLAHTFYKGSSSLCGAAVKKVGIDEKLEKIANAYLEVFKSKVDGLTSKKIGNFDLGLFFTPEGKGLALGSRVAVGPVHATYGLEGVIHGHKGHECLGFFCKVGVGAETSLRPAGIGFTGELAQSLNCVDNESYRGTFLSFESEVELFVNGIGIAYAFGVNPEKGLKALDSLLKNHPESFKAFRKELFKVLKTGTNELIKSTAASIALVLRKIKPELIPVDLVSLSYRELRGNKSFSKLVERASSKKKNSSYKSKSAKNGHCHKGTIPSIGCHIQNIAQNGIRGFSKEANRVFDPLAKLFTGCDNVALEIEIGADGDLDDAIGLAHAAAGVPPVELLAIEADMTSYELMGELPLKDVTSLMNPKDHLNLICTVDDVKRNRYLDRLLLTAKSLKSIFKKNFLSCSAKAAKDNFMNVTQTIGSSISYASRGHRLEKDEIQSALAKVIKVEPSDLKKAFNGDSYHPLSVGSCGKNSHH